MTLTAAAFVLLLVLAWTVTAVVQPVAVACSNAPARTTSIPQWFEVVVCVAGFVLGRVTARPKVVRRSEMRDWTSERADTSTGGDPRATVALWTQGSLVAALFLFTLLLAFEAVTTAANVWPITYYLRCANEVAPVRALVGAFAFCFLAGRWLWLPQSPREA